MNNPPAFPYAFQHEDDTHFIAQGFSPGMTLRDYFAIHAPSSDLWKYQFVYEGPEKAPRELSDVEKRYAFADAMLTERAKANMADMTSRPKSD